ncbi:MAG: RHS repeat-associated core domain-containing protein [Chloroflexi bacterium]|nr:RHS repeat-associated core domain-containing protein [Chloroflexota bacterium]
MAAGGGRRTLYDHWWPFGAPNREADPFGDPRHPEEPRDVRVNFTGQRRDAATGLGFYNARYYDSEIGRFISADSIVPGGTRADMFNRYVYVSNNPLKYKDPSGHIGDEANDSPNPYIIDVGKPLARSNPYHENPQMYPDQLMTTDVAYWAGRQYRPDSGVAIVSIGPAAGGSGYFVAVQSLGGEDFYYASGTQSDLNISSGELAAQFEPQEHVISVEQTSEVSAFGLTNRKSFSGSVPGIGGVSGDRDGNVTVTTPLNTIATGIATLSRRLRNRDPIGLARDVMSLRDDFSGATWQTNYSYVGGTWGHGSRRIKVFEGNY